MKRQEKTRRILRVFRILLSVGGLLGAVLGGGRQAPAPQPEPQQNPYGAGLDMLQGMFQTGQQVQSSQMDAFSQILGQLTQKR